jgi:hypothetical protein
MNYNYILLLLGIASSLVIDITTSKPMMVQQLDGKGIFIMEATQISLK